jgi:precorrin-3B methylase
MRLVALALMLTAGLLYVGFTRPMRAQEAVAFEQHQRARADREQARVRLATAERRDTARLRAAEVVAAASAAGPPNLIALRRRVLDVLQTEPVKSVRLELRPGVAGAASVHVVLEGPYERVVALSGALLRSGTGLILERARFAPGQAGLMMELDALVVGGRS